MGLSLALLSWLTDPWAEALTRRALVEVVLLGAAGGALGCWLVFFNLAYSAESLAHALLPGLVGAALLGVPLLLGGAAGLLVGAIAVAVAGRIPGLDRDTAVAVVVTSLFGLGVLLALTPESPAGLQGLLFGDVLGVSDGDLLLAALLVALVLAALWVAHDRLLIVGFDRLNAPGLGVRPLAVDVALLVLLAAALLVAVQGLGNLLVVAVLIAPASAARLVTERMGPMILASAGIAVLAGVGGMYVSFHAGTAAGASIAGLLVLAYVAVAAGRAVAGVRPRHAVARPRRRPDRVRAWLLLAAGVAGGGALAERMGLPSAYLFVALLAGLGIALLRPGSLDVAPPTFRAAQAVAGVTLGAYLTSSSLRGLGEDWLPVALVSAATLALSLGAGRLLARTTPLDEPTAALGLIAGGASGIVGMSGELGADDRLVAFMQYLRVLIVVLSTPLVIAIGFPGDHGVAVGAAPSAPVLGDLRGWILTVVLGGVGVALAARARLTAGVLLGPMLLTGVVVLAVPGGAFVVPPLGRELAFAVIGLQVGLRFTTDTIRLLGRLLVPVTLVILGLLGACFGLAVALAAATSATLLDSYLATTPGGLYAVLAVATGSGADTTFVVGVQTLRVVVMVLVAPVAVRWAVARPAARGRDSGGDGVPESRTG